MNPWLKVPYDEHVAHMSRDTVYQLQQLNSIFKDSLVDHQPTSILVLGCGGGNGFEHIDPRTTTYVAGIDINASYLELCRQHYQDRGYYLDLIPRDINQDPLESKVFTSRTSNQFDLITAYLFLEYVDEAQLLESLLPLMKDNSLLSIVIQESKAQTFVSQTGIKSLEALGSIAKEVDKDRLENLLASKALKIQSRTSHDLPNGKGLIVYNCSKIEGD